MKIPSVLVLLSLLAIPASHVPVHAQPAPAAPAAAEAATQIEVTDVKFAGARSPSGETWLEVNVEVNAKPGGRSVSSEFLDRVRVTLNLAIDLAAEGGAQKRAFYRGSAEAIALEGGTKSTFRFYLPPEVIKRDRVRPGNEGKHYVVELEVDGKPVPPARTNVSPEIKSQESIRGFLGLVGSDGGKNEGVLVPQHLSPFAYDSQRRAPSVFRREGQR